MMKQEKSRQAGVSLLEVLISLVIVMLGIVAVMQLQGIFLRVSTDADQRATAMQLAEQKFEEWRSFDVINASEADNAVVGALGSMIPEGTASEALTIDNTNYLLTWTVDDEVKASSGSGGSLLIKNIDLTVTWDDASPESTLQVSTIISAVSPGLSPLAGEDSAAGGTPDVDYDAGEAPDVISIKVGDDKLKETTLPLPSIKNNSESTEVKFSTVTYSIDKKQLIREDFLTVNCECSLNSSTRSIPTPYHYDLSVQDGSYNIELVPGRIATVKTGSAKSGQSTFCKRCCEWHHDSSSNTLYTDNDIPAFKDSVPSAASVAHKHYDTAASGSAPTVAVNGPVASGDYVEACRFARVDGIYRLVPDWKQIDLNVFTRSQLVSSATSSLKTYQEYVVNKVAAEVMRPYVADGNVSARVAAADASVAALSAQLVASGAFETVSGDITQLQARSIYLDDISYDSDFEDFIKGVASDADWFLNGTWLEFVPFNEINVTLLASWAPSSINVADVTSETIDKSIDDAIDFYGSYSRGEVLGGAASGAATIIASSKDDNTGILGNIYAAEHPSLDGYDNRIVPSVSSHVASLSVTNNAACVSGTCIISGYISRANSARNLSFDDFEFSFSGANNCAFKFDLGDALFEATNRATFTCEAASGISGTISITDTSGTGTVSAKPPATGGQYSVGPYGDGGLSFEVKVP